LINLCKFISKEVVILYFCEGNLLIIIVKQPSASVNPITHKGFSGGTAVEDKEYKVAALGFGLVHKVRRPSLRPSKMRQKGTEK
jgi:hypothetical protein